LFLRDKTSMVGIAFAGLTANVAAVCKRFLIVVPSQVEGSMISVERSHLAYHPTWIEYAVVGGLFCFMVVMQLLFGRFFPLVPAAHTAPPGDPAPDRRRIFATIATACVAVVMIVVGLTDSFRLWSGAEFDPRIHFSPVIFAAGVMTLFISAIVYEAFPERRVPEREKWLAHKAAQQQAGLLPWGAKASTAFEPLRGREPIQDLPAYRGLLRLAMEAEEAASKGDPHRAKEAARRLETAARELHRRTT
jgi:hypothetical protein